MVPGWRGWGDLLHGMPLMWPVPNEEMDSRQEPFYNMGGFGPAEFGRKGDVRFLSGDFGYAGAFLSALAILLQGCYETLPLQQGAAADRRPACSW